MVQSVLGSLILGYRPLWNRARKLAGIQLYAHNEATAVVDAGHLLRTLQELWSASSPPLLISAQTRQLLCDLLEHAPRGAPWIEVRGDWLSDSAIYSRVKAAHQRGLKLVWRGDASKLPEPEIARCFDNSLLTLRPEDAVAALQTAPARPGAPAPRPRQRAPPAPYWPGRCMKAWPAARSWNIAWTTAARWPWRAGRRKTCSTACATTRSSRRTP